MPYFDGCGRPFIPRSHADNVQTGQILGFDIVRECGAALGPARIAGIVMTALELLIWATVWWDQHLAEAAAADR